MKIDWEKYLGSELDEIEKRIYDYEINHFSADVTLDDVRVYPPKGQFENSGLNKLEAEELVKNLRLEFGNREHILLSDLIDYLSLNLLLYSFIP